MLEVVAPPEALQEVAEEDHPKVKAEEALMVAPEVEEAPQVVPEAVAGVLQVAVHLQAYSKRTFLPTFPLV